MVFTFTEALALNASSPDFTKKGIDIVGKTGIEASSTQFNEALTDGSFLVLNSKSYTSTGAGITLDLSKYLHLMTTSTLNDVVSVPDGTYAGQQIIIVLETDGGGKLTLSMNKTDYPPVFALNDTGENATLVWIGNKWCCVYQGYIA